jgi:protein-disulfide isomerase
MTSVTNAPRPSKNERRDAAREKARVLREQQQRRQRRNRALLQSGIVLVVLAIVAVVALVIVNAVRPPGPGPRNMASDGITITQGNKAVPSGATASGGDPAAAPRPSTGKIVIRAYEDFGCPFCAQFEQTNTAYIESLLQNGSATLTIYPVSILDRNFQGTKYSTRAANAAAAVADLSPNQFFAFHKLLYANQPAEGSTGLSDDRLIAYAKQAKVTNLSQITDAIHDHRFYSWVGDATDRFLKGNLSGSDVKQVTGTPVVIVNGKQYTGSLTDQATFSSFVLQTAAAYTSAPTPSAKPTATPSAKSTTPKPSSSKKP